MFREGLELDSTAANTTTSARKATLQTSQFIGKTAAPAAPSPSTAAWRALGWFGSVLAFVGLADVLLVFYPARFGDPGWEFGVLATAVSSLPLLMVGLAAQLGSAMALERKWLARGVAAFAILLGIATLFVFAVYLTTVPIALKLAPEEVMAGIYKSIMRTTVMATAFSITFISAGVFTIRSSRTPRLAR